MQVNKIPSKDKNDMNMYWNSTTSVLILTARGNFGKAEGGYLMNILIIFDNRSKRSYIANYVKDNLGLP